MRFRKPKREIVLANDALGQAARELAAAEKYYREVREIRDQAEAKRKDARDATEAARSRLINLRHEIERAASNPAPEDTE